MKPFIRLMSVCSVLLAVAVATPSAAAHDEGADVTTETEMSRHGGMGEIYERALDDAQLRPEQRAEVDKLIAKAKERHAPAKKAKGEFMLALADQIDSGKVDRCALAPKTKALAKAQAEAMPGDREAMEKMHALLDPEQRRRFADSVTKRFEELKKEHTVDAIVDKMASKLKLTEAQKTSLRDVLEGLEQIRDAEPGYKEHKARKTRLIEAFKGEHFDIDEIAPLEDAEARATKRIEAKLWAAEAVLPILNEEQRAKVAKVVREKADRLSATIQADKEEAEDREPAEEDKEPAEDKVDREENLDD